MANASESSALQPMEGGGAYNRESRVLVAGLLPAIALLQSSAAVAKLARSPQSIVVVDYGSSEGRNSLAAPERFAIPLAKLVVRKR